MPPCAAQAGRAGWPPPGLAEPGSGARGRDPAQLGTPATARFTRIGWRRITPSGPTLPRRTSPRHARCGLTRKAGATWPPAQAGDETLLDEDVTYL